MKTLLRIILASTIVGLLSVPSILFSQDTQPLTLERVWFTGEFRQERAPRIQWYKDGSSYITTERSSTAAGSDFILTNAKSGKTSTLIKAEELIPAGQSDPLSYDSYTWSEDFSKMLLFTNTQRVWRANTKGDYWLFDLDTKKLSQLGKTLPESSLMFAKLSPDQKSAGYVSGFNIYVEDLASGNVSQLTKDGTEDIINGTFDWVYEEEFSCRDGFRFNDSGNKIAFWQLDASKIRDFYMINNTDSLYPFLVPVQYPKVGEDPSRCRVAVVDVNTGERTWMKIPGDDVQNYIPRLQWVGAKVLVQQLNRKQNELKFWMCDPRTGEAELLYSEKDDAYIEIQNNDFSSDSFDMYDMEMVSKTSELVHVTEKDGWRHLYGVNSSSGGDRCITPFDYDVASVKLIDVKGNTAYFMASPENATQRYLYSTALSGSRSAARLTPTEFEGVNSYNISPNGKYAIHGHSSHTTPRTTHLISLPSHKVIRTLAANEDYKAKMHSLAYPIAEFMKVKTEDGIELDARVLKPSDFDPSKKYPVLFYVYGEPWGQTSVDGWNFGYDNVIAEMGYIVITMDNRGTPCPRGREWRKSIYRQIGRVNIRDQAMGAKEIAKLPYVDAERIAVWGWSGGGSSTLNLMFQYPDVYSAGIAVAPVANFLYYDNAYQERYMGVPWESKDDYIAGSPVTHAKNLQGDLLIIHGTGDDNVHYQATEILINELVKHGKQFQIMPYPNRSHGIWEGEGTTMHLYNLMMNFLKDNLESGGK